MKTGPGPESSGKRFSGIWNAPHLTDETIRGTADPIRE